MTATRDTDTGQPGLLTGTFRDRASAERAYDALISRGYTKDEVNILMSDTTRRRHFSMDAARGETELGSKAAEGAVTGAAVGGVAGALAGLLVAAGAVALPGLGLIIAGPLAGALMGLGAGGATGGLIGALIGAGIPEERAKVYESDIKGGGIVMGVQPRSAEDAVYFEREWLSYGAENIHR
ncbi:MAG TPA: hypothetical protein VFY16_13535 [Gemmatimonadaceae bacterium]|nr:hypothetical protein [Gemmatimonadaceae bacterium]